MSKIRSKNTRIEKAVFSELKKANLGRFEYQPKITGNPDFAFHAEKIAIFCDGDFWHGYKFKTQRYKLNQFWQNKISANMKRDRRNRNKMKKDGWAIIRLWGHEIKNSPAKCIVKIQKTLEERNETRNSG